MNEPICSHCGGGPASEGHQRECEEDTVLYQQQSRIADLEVENARLQARVENHRVAREGLREWFDTAVCERDGYKALAERRGEALPVIVFALEYYDFGDGNTTWEDCVEVWRRRYEPALQEKHGGDCTNDCYSCARCQAENVVELASKIDAALAATPDEPPQPLRPPRPKA